MRILLISNHYPPYYIGGYELVAEQVASKLGAQGQELIILTSNYGFDKETYLGNYFDLKKKKEDLFLYKNFFIDGAFRCLKYRRHKHLVNLKQWIGQRFFSWFNFSVTLDFIKLFQPDLVYLWNLDTLTLAPLIATKVKRIPYLYDLSDFHVKLYDYGEYDRAGDWQFFFRIMQRIYAFYLKYIIQLNHISWVSKSLKKIYYEEGIEAEQEKVIYRGLSFLPRIKRQTRKPAGKKILLFVGQIIENKGVLVLLEALSMLIENYRITDFELILVGGSDAEFGNILQDYLAALNLQNKIVMTGKLSKNDLEYYYQGADIFVFPSIWNEPFSLTLLEAMSFGLPVIATSAGGSAEILKSGENALVVKANEPEALAEAIASLWQDKELQNKLGKNARITIEKDYLFENKVSQINQFINELSK